jgi:N utilization substance protein A
VGVRGSRIKNIVEELGGEKIDIVRWNESSQILIQNALKPAEVAEVSLCFELGRATVVVNEDQLSLAIGKRGQNVRLAARLTGWDIDILTPPEFQKGVTRLDATLKQIEGVLQEHVDKVIALGLIDVRDIEEVGIGPLMEEVGLSEEVAQQVLDRCADEAKVVQKEQEEKKAADAVAKAQGFANARASATDQATAGGASSAFNPLLQGTASEGDRSEPGADEGVATESPGTMPSTLESTEGLAPEVTTHSEHSTADPSELSPEEQAIQVPGGATEGDPERREFTDEDSDAAALAEGRVDPPVTE